MKPTEEYILRQPQPYQAMILHVLAVVEQELPQSELLFNGVFRMCILRTNHFVILLLITKKDF